MPSFVRATSELRVAVFALMIFSVAACKKSDPSTPEAKSEGPATSKVAKANTVPEAKFEKPVGSKPAKPENPATSVPGFTVRAVEFGAEVNKDAKAATDKYKGAVIEISGIVESVQSAAEQSVIVLDVPKNSIGVPCHTNVKEVWTTILPGQFVKLKGMCPDKLERSGHLLDCVVVDAGKDRPQIVEAEAYVKEYLANREAAAKKYNDKWMIVEGEFLRQGEEEGVLTAWLKGDNKLNVKCHFGFENKRTVDGFKRGAKVRFAGQASFVTNENSDPFFNKSLPISSMK